MAVTIVKRVSIDPTRRRVSMASALSNLPPREYDTWHPLDHGIAFDEWLETFARDCFDGSVEFLPSCESKAHEAYLRTCEQLGGAYEYAHDNFEIDGFEYEAFRKGWCDIFIDFILFGERDTRKFIISHDGYDVTISIRHDDNSLHGLSAQYTETRWPKPVSWIKKTLIVRSFRDFAAREV